ncbi:uncharacterized protein LOC127872669 [Dreissena polymorpha]|uniref:uncharacterized protein LOC127872669 n=1 Tax=Dreissena polymorpha TaxID=45954 RepID=UPI0022643B93|nr:uncharacterized protein LOC127872669 [Dreissena polymorpha]
MELKLKLKAGAIPTIFPETEAYKASKKSPLNPNDLGPGKHNRAKLHLAALHSVANANRKQAETRQGEKRYRLSYPTYKAGHHVVKAVKENCTYDYVDEVMAELLRMKEEYKSDANARAASGNILFSLPPLSSSANRILKSEAVQK